jgi:hypothetical protein
LVGKRPPLAEEGGEELERRRTETRFLRLENMLSGARAEDVALVRSSSLSGGGDVDAMAMAMAMAIIEDDVRHAFQEYDAGGHLLSPSPRRCKRRRPRWRSRGRRRFLLQGRSARRRRRRRRLLRIIVGSIRGFGEQCRVR